MNAQCSGRAAGRDLMLFNKEEIVSGGCPQANQVLSAGEKKLSEVWLSSGPTGCSRPVRREL